MNAFNQFVVAVLAQVTLVTLVALVLIRFARRSSVVRHAVGVVGLVLVVSCPMLVLALPRPAWLQDESAEGHIDVIRSKGVTIHSIAT